MTSNDRTGLADVTVREERASDAAAIDDVVREAFRAHPFSQQTEHRIVRGLRDAGALALSLVALDGDTLVGHVAFSAVSIDDRDRGWIGLGPLAVRPAHQRRGIGAALVRRGLAQLAARGAAGCVVLGDPAYYGRFGFAAAPGLDLPGVPADHFQALAMHGSAPVGRVDYHAAFGAPPP